MVYWISLWLHDFEHFGGPIEETLVLADRKMKVRKILKAIYRSHGSMVPILNYDLVIRGVFARCVPLLLIIDHKHHLTISKDWLFNRNPNEFLCRFITVEETFSHSVKLEIKRSKQLISVSETAPKKAKVGPSPHKVMSMLFYLTASSTST